MSWNTEWDKEFIEWDITSKLFLNMFDIRIIYILYIYMCACVSETIGFFTET